MRDISQTRQNGTAVVEFAILLPLLILLVFGITEYGRAMYQYDTLTKSVRSAVRYLSWRNAGDATAIGVAKCLALNGNSSCTGKTLLPDMTGVSISVCDRVSCSGSHLNQPTGSGTINLVTVTISGYHFDSLVPGLFSGITFSDISATMRQGQL